MKRRYSTLLAACLTLLPGCNDFLDVNTNPNAPQAVSANLYLPPMLFWMATTPIWDGRFVGRYNQEWMLPSTPLNNWDRMGYDKLSDGGGEQWKAVYWELGQNLVDMNTKAEAEQRWDLLGVGLLLKAWGWQAVADMHGEVIIKEAFDQTRFSFDYDSQKYAYEEVDRLLTEAIKDLNRTDGAVDQAYLAKGDHIYNGDRSKWLKFAYALRALHLNHYSNKPSYDPAAVIAAVDSSFASNDDDPLMSFPATNNDDRNFMGRTRGNYPSYRQTEFVVALMDGTDFGGVVDPRMSRMLSMAPDSQYRGLNPNNTGFGGYPASQIPNNLYGYPSTGGVGLPGKYLFADKAKIPVMTYAQLQFVKAEAAYRLGQKDVALAAYTKGISSHIDFVNDRNRDDNQWPTQITAAEKAAFLGDTAIVPTDPNNLTLTKIMSQKYIAQWAWGHDEMWMDLRRYHYTDIDPASGVQVFPNFQIPTDLYPDNDGKPVQRMRPRYNSEYVWNQAGLDAIGGLDPDYQTVPLWIITADQ